MPSQKKKTYVEDLSKSLSEAKHFALVQFGNTTHTTLEKLRKELKKDGARLQIVKNTLFEKTIEKLGASSKNFKELQEKVLPLQDNSAILILSEAYHKGLSAFYKFAKGEGALTFKFGLLDKELLTKEILEQIAQLPDKEILLAKIIGSMKSPPSRLVYAMKFNVSKLVYILREKGKQAS